MIKYFVDTGGTYLGAFEGAEPPDEAIEVVEPPRHFLDKWNGFGWTRYVPQPPLKTVDEKIVELSERLAKIEAKVNEEEAK